LYSNVPFRFHGARSHTAFTRSYSLSITVHESHRVCGLLVPKHLPNSHGYEALRVRVTVHEENAPLTRGECRDERINDVSHGNPLGVGLRTVPTGTRLSNRPADGMCLPEHRSHFKVIPP
jgi:hypothetical protein